MSDGEATGDVPELPKGSKGSGTARFALNAVSGALPLVGGLLSAGASAWSEREQARINDFLKHLAVAAEMKEKTQTILELTARIDMQDEKTAERIRSEEYQSLLRKAFRDWAGTESEEKRILVRNLLSNAASSTLREDSSDADLFRLMFRDLSTGGIVRQHRETDYQGNFLAKPTRRGPPIQKGTPRTMKSAFDDGEQYELTALGEQFVHYAMTDVPPKLEFKEAS